ncbi:MAG: M20/M25/M40 family metallo-hydrolase [Cyclobacteriaceae bacterium]|nr:M20/M25/M40 family metallo-hydrolase [Cyclobacteriaceae bacterium]
MKRSILLPVIIFTCICPGFAQKNPDLDKVSATYATQSFREFYDMLSLPNDAHFPQDIEKNVQWCEQAFTKRGFSTQRLITPAVPLLLAERKVKNAKKTVLIYLQLDGQPVEPSQWQQESPWKPTLKEKDASGKWHTIAYERLYEGFDPDWRIFARSASDAKGPAIAFLAALDAAQALKIQPNYNIKVIMDFEEELGSPNLPPAVIQYKNELAADMLIIYDGPRHVSNQPTLSFGARGICEITLTTFGPRVPVHSGNYGNYTPNPAMRLARLLASMKNDEGRVTIPGFYDGITLTDEEKAILKQVPDNEAEIKKFLGIAKADNMGDNFQESLQYPTLNIRGLDALFVGKEARTLIPATATAEIDIRLVPGSNPDRLIGLVKKHVQDQGYYVIDREPTEEERMQHEKIASFRSHFSYAAFQTPFQSGPGVWLNKAMIKAFGKEPIKIRMMGGSIPISPFVTTLNIPAVSVPTVNADNNQHAENENIRVGNYVDAVKTFLVILMEKL